MRRLALLGVLVLTAAIALATQQRLVSAAQERDRTLPSTQTKFLAAGPFFFKPGAIHPTYMDAFDTRPVVGSPNGKLAVTITGPKKSWAAWVTINPSEFPGGPIQVWPIQANVDVLWRPDSQSLALTDNRGANDSYVLIFGTHFRMGEGGRGLGVPVTNLTPIIEKDFDAHAQKFYAGEDYDTDLFYAKTLRWVGNQLLLVGLAAKTSLSNVPSGSTWRNMKIKEWYLGYVLDVSQKKVVRELSESQLLSQYGIGVAK